ncbi:MAG: hypothetical protein IT444_00240 [Phycisphaeraceae bacterium]|nr:hypothetical protein [Phycisphaeraceae bacterium]
MRKNIVLAVGVSALFTGSALAQSDVESLRQEVAQLRAANEEMRQQIDTLMADKDHQWLDQRRAVEVKALVKEVLADADTRASLADSGITAGHNSAGFFLASEDGAFLLRTSGFLQIRYVAAFRESSSVTPAGFDTGENGLQMRRVKLAFEGHVASPKVQYKIQFDVDRNTSTIGTQDLWIAYSPVEEFRVLGGRFADRFAREAMMSGKNLQAADRTAVAQIWAGGDDYVEGIAAEWKIGDNIIWSGSINDGLNSGTPNATGATSGFQTGGHDFQNDATDFALTSRIELALMGDFKNSSDAEAWSSSPDPQVFLGAAIHYELGETGDRQRAASFTVTPTGAAATTITYDSFIQWTADALVKFQGLSVMGAVYGWHIQDAVVLPGGALPAGDTGTLDQYAATIQAGYFVIPDKLEPFVRYEWITVDDALAANDLHALTTGFNYFLRKHATKFTLDAVWAMSNINSVNTLGVGISGTGLLPDASGEDDQVVIRGQVQLIF